MATQQTIGNNYYDNNINNTFITSRNFNGTLSPTAINNLLFPCDKLDNYYFDTLLYLHLFSSLYISLENFQSANSYNITRFTEAINNLNISITNSSNVAANIGMITNITNAASSSTITSATFTFDLYNFKRLAIQQTSLETPTGYIYSSISLTNTIVNKMIPLTYNLNNFNETTSSFSNIETAGYTNYTNSGQMNTDNAITTTFNLSSFTNSGTIKNILATEYITNYNNESRKQKLYAILYNILKQSPENIMGYLLFNKIYYNIILCNLSIQADIRQHYINKSFSGTTTNLYGSIGGNRWSITDDGTTSNSNIIDNGRNKVNIAAVNTSILNSKNIITKLLNNHFPSINNDNSLIDPTTAGTRYFLTNKAGYANKIDLYQNIYNRYLDSQDMLNNIIATYNQYIKDFNKIRNYGNIVIIILIAIAIFVIALSVLPIVNANSKQAIYIILLIALIVMTYLFYDNFRYINIVEQFASTANVIDNTDGFACRPMALYNTNNAWVRYNNNQFYLVLTDSINSYTNELTNLLNKVRANIYITGARTFNQNTDNLMIAIQRDKLSKIASFNNKKINLLNMIEVMKKQLSYTFNLILLFCLFLIILLIALLIYSSIPDAFPFIIGISIILIICFLTYFIVAIVQPTRMKATNNYWGNFKPSTTTLNSL